MLGKITVKRIGTDEPKRGLVYPDIPNDKPFTWDGYPGLAIKTTGGRIGIFTDLEQVAIFTNNMDIETARQIAKTGRYVDLEIIIKDPNANL